MKKPTELLAEDHQIVLKKLDQMEEAIGKLSQKVGDPIPVLKEIAAFLKKDVEIHFVKEEEALFPEMEKFMPRNEGPIGVMLMEHEDLNTSKANFLKGLENYAGHNGDKGAAELIVNNGRRFLSVLRGHIDKEDNILFMMADMHLEDSQNEEILKKFQDIEKRGQ